MAAIVAWFKGKKTYIIVGFGVATVLVHFITGDLTLMQFIASDEFVKLLELLGLGTVRAGAHKI